MTTRSLIGRQFFRLLDQGIVEGDENYSGWPTRARSRCRKRFSGYEIKTSAITPWPSFQQRGFERVLKRIRREVDKGPDAFFRFHRCKRY